MALDLARVPWSLLMALVSLGLVAVLFRFDRDLFDRMGFGGKELVLLVLGSAAGWAVNVPVLIVGGTYVAVNLGGAIVPLILVGHWVRRRRLRPLWTLAGVVAVSLATWRVVEFHPSSGIVTRYPLFFLPVVVALLFGVLASFGRKGGAGGGAPVAYASGSIGALVGADLLNLPAIRDHFVSAPENTIISIGGAGIFDMVFLAGTVAMALLLTGLSFVPRGSRRAGGAGGGAAVAIPSAVAGASAAAEDGAAPSPTVPVPAEYPLRPLRLEDSRRVWDSYLRIEQPNALERALAGLALSDLALREGDFARSVRMSWLAVDSLLRHDEVRRRLDEGLPVAVREDVARLGARYQSARASDVALRDAGEANSTARVLLASLAPHARLDHTLEGVA